MNTLGWLIYNRRGRGIAIQCLVALICILLVGFFGGNAYSNLQKLGIAGGFDFLAEKASYDIAFHFLPYSPDDTHFYAYVVGTSNTLLFAISAIILTTIISLVVAVARLSPIWLLQKTTYALVDYTRNVPMLLHIFLWYSILLGSLPVVRKAYNLGDTVFLANRGLFFPTVSATYELGLWILLSLLPLALLFRGPWPRFSRTIIILVALLWSVALVWIIDPFIWSVPELKGLNFKGGGAIPPEFITMWIGVSVYSSAHASEVIRGGILAVARGQKEAGEALGVRSWPLLRDIVIPQSLPIIVPPMTSIYINLAKASSLGAAVGFVDIMGTMGGSTLNITGQAIECLLIVMLTYVVINLFISSVMAWVNRAVALPQR